MPKTSARVRARKIKLIIFDVDGVPVRTAGKQALIRLKDTIRPSDRVDVDVLRARLAAEDALRP